MRTLPADLAAHLAGCATTTCHAWRVTRRDGVVFGFTEHDRDLVLDGTVFVATTGYQASDTEAELGLSAATADVTGAFSGDAITEKDLREGRFDGARVELFLVNWANPAQFVHLKTQTIGEVRLEGGAFRAELRGLSSRLDQVQGRLYGRRCDADLGDQRCGVDLSNASYRGEGTVVAAEDRSGCTADGLSAFSDGWFLYGLLQWTTGANAGLSVEINDHRAKPGGEADLTFWSDVANRPEPGDAFVVTAGCAKTFDECRRKFANGAHFQGFPHMPGSDFAYGYADGDTVHDGRPIVP